MPHLLKVNDLAASLLDTKIRLRAAVDDDNTVLLPETGRRSLSDAVRYRSI